MPAACCRKSGKKILCACLVVSLATAQVLIVWLILGKNQVPENGRAGRSNELADAPRAGRESELTDRFTERAAKTMRPAQFASSRKHRCQRDNVFPSPVIGELLGDELREVDCRGALVLDDCCAQACREEPLCSFWYADAGSKCKLRGKYRGMKEVDLRKFPRGHWKDAKKLSMTDAFPQSSSLEDDLESLRRELKLQCPDPQWSPSKHSRDPKDVEKWLKWALAQEDGQVREFPDHNLLLSTKTCHDPSMERSNRLPFFLMSRKGKTDAKDVQAVDLIAQVNKNAFGKVKKPGCPFGPHAILSYNVGKPLPRKTTGKVPTPRGVAFLNSDIWSNIGHSIQHIAWLDAALRNAAFKADVLKHEKIEVVATWGGRFLNYGSFVQMVLTALKIPKFVLNTDRIRCYKVVAQRLFQYSPYRSDYTFTDRVIHSCNLRRAMGRKALLWYKQLAGHGMFAEFSRFKCALEEFCKSVDFQLRVTELSATDLSGMSSCEQVRIFSELALFLGVHGAAGVHSLWLPSDAVFVEIYPNPEANGRLSAYGYYSEWAAMSGALYTHYQFGLGMGYSRFDEDIRATYFSYDAQTDLVPLLAEIYESWLKPRLEASLSAGSHRK
eukprot:TRINITY_DN22315_c0_g1_i1.p1 TRINITY_DN22315_c0_g1~~TRINITY_DN22315_c0_g1_i1.p1  ORF type:complete len:626 (+),score=80.78 TRINITY_DN22315_c0_g1_i1:46-1878(+)